MIVALSRLAGLLVLPLAGLLFAQWPLRDLVQAYSREANDLAQVIFALYMAVAVSAASHAGTHLAAGHGAARRTRWRAWALFICLAPWSVYMLWASYGPVSRSLLQLEKFSETLSPGFFMVKLALWLLLALVLLDAVQGLRKPRLDD